MSGTITHKWNGTVLTITSDSGTSSADLKGEKGDMGIRGAQGEAGLRGKDGTDANVDLTGYATQDYVNDAVSNVQVDLSDYASKEYVNNAVSNVKVDLTDYATKDFVIDSVGSVQVDLSGYATKEYVNSKDSDLTNMINNVSDIGKAYTDNKIIDLNATGIQQTPLYPQINDTVENAFAWLETSGDTSKVYVLPDGYIYAYRNVIKEGGEPLFTNLAKPSASDWKANSRINASGSVASSGESGAFVSNIFSCKSGDILRVKGVTGTNTGSSTGTYFKFFPLKADGTNFNANGGFYLINCPETVEKGSRLVGDIVNITDDNVYEYTILLDATGAQTYNHANVAQGRVTGLATNGAENVIITINQEINYSEAQNGNKWENTGKAFVPADYEDRIIELETKMDSALSDIRELEQNKSNIPLTSPVVWCAMGDSITQGYVSYLNGNTPTSKVEASSAWAAKLAALKGWALTNKAIGGTGYIDLENSDTVGTTAAWQIARNTDFTPYNLVTLAYGVNDWKGNIALGTINDATANPTTIYGGIKATIEAIIESNPLCKIVVITPLNCVGYNFDYGTEDTNWGLAKSFSKSGTLENVFQAIVDVCDYYGIDYVDMTHRAVVNRKNILECLIDGVHPSAETHTLLAYELAKKIQVI